MKHFHKSKCLVLHSNKFNRGSISRGCRDAFIWLSRPHFIHPSTAIILVSPKYESSFLVKSNFNIESFISHMSINLVPSIPLSKSDSRGMSLKYFVHHFNQFYLSCWLMSIHSFNMKSLIMLVSEMQFYFFIQKFIRITLWLWHVKILNRL